MKSLNILRRLIPKSLMMYVILSVCVYVYTIILGGVACYNSGCGYYSNNHYLFNTLLILY